MVKIKTKLLSSEMEDKDIKIIHGDGESKNVEISKRGDGEVKEQVIRSEKQQSLNVEYLTSSLNQVTDK